MMKRILFIGDSITDAGRDYSNQNDLGKGYPLLVAGKLSAKYPEKDFLFLNRGINGNKLIDVRNRWQADCLEWRPDIVSILIGINDTWHNVSDPTEFALVKSLQRFEDNYRYLLESLKENNISNIVLMEPFVLPIPEDRKSWRRDIDQKIHTIRHLAEEYHALFVPLDGNLNALGIRYGFEKYTAEDGVHPTNLGHEIIARSWIESIQTKEEWL